MSMRGLMSTHTVTIQVQATVAGDHMGFVRTWTNVETGFPCRVVPMSARDTLELQKEGMRLTHAVFFWKNPNVDERNRFLYTDKDNVAHTLHVQHVVNPDELNRFWRVDCDERRDVDNTAA